MSPVVDQTISGLGRWTGPHLFALSFHESQVQWCQWRREITELHMGNYLNPGNMGFQEIRNAEYVDKSGLIELVNRTIRTPQKLSCVSRPRRFGKSFAAKMLCAYYDRSCDSHALFDDLAISQSPTYEAHLNKYDVLYVDMTAVIGEVGVENLISHIRQRITE